MDKERKVSISLIRFRAREYEQSPYSIKHDDAKDLRIIADLLEDEQDRLAGYRARDLDTAVREDLPCVSWELLGIKPSPQYADEYRRQVKEALDTQD